MQLRILILIKEIFHCYKNKENGMITKLIGYDEIILISNINFIRILSVGSIIELPLILIDDKNFLDFSIR